MIGQWNSGLMACPYASKNSSMPPRKPIITSQWAMPTVRNLIIRVWAMNSLIIVHMRGITGKNRELGTLWPSRMVRTMPNAPRTNANQHARLISTPIVPSVAVMGVTGAYRPSCWSIHLFCVQG